MSVSRALVKSRSCAACSRGALNNCDQRPGDFPSTTERRVIALLRKGLFEGSQHLHAFRNLAAHAQDEVAISREDAEDLQTFVYAIVEYIYDLTDRYEEFKARISACQKSKSA
jgi:hypothetical protein